MKISLGRLIPPAALAIPILLLTACAASAPPAASPAAAPAQSLPAAASAIIPVVDQELLADFAAAQQSINADWNAFHADFDTWRAGLAACDRSAVQAALRDFAGDFDAIVQQSQDLPGAGITRGLAYRAVDAAVFEARALRQYRDQWQPGDTALAEAVQLEQDNAARLLRETADELDELSESDDPEQRAAAQALSDSLKPINAPWDALHNDYDALSQNQAEIAPVQEVIDQVADLLTTLRFDIIAPLEKLESDDDAVREVADTLLSAAQDEADAMGELLDGITLRSQEIDDSAAGGPPPDLAALLQLETDAAGADDPTAAVSSENGGSGAEPPPPPGPEPVDNYDLFAVMDEQVDTANQTRKENRRVLDKLIKGVKESDRQALADFTTALAALQQDWDAFHADYDQWVSADGGCDRAAAIQSLAEFQQRFNGLGARVRGLSQASYLRPPADLLTAAIAGEESAMRALTTSWQPYAADLYRPLDQERAKAANLRRQSDRRTQELLERHGAG